MMHDVRCDFYSEGNVMRTTVSIDDDVLLAVKSMADRQNLTLGEVLSTLARQALRREPHPGGKPELRNGVPLLPRRGQATPVTPELVNQLRDELA
jgi:hypothetical protein